MALNRGPPLHFLRENQKKYTPSKELQLVLKQSNSLCQKQHVQRLFFGNLQQAMTQEDCWAQHALSTVDKQVRSTDVITWSSYHGSMNRPPSISPVISGLLPLFYEKASSLAMVKHGMEMQRQATAHLNPGQIPVTLFDQPLFAIAKFVQWI